MARVRTNIELDSRCTHEDRGLILADTSEWVEYDRATGSPVDQRVTEPVIMEVTAGADLRVMTATCGSHQDATLTAVNGR